MMKICIVGNSHLAAVKLALADAMVEVPGVEFSFWGASGNGYHRSFVENGALKLPEKYAKEVGMVADGKFTEVDPRQFDCIIFHGASIDLFRLIFAIAKDATENRYLSSGLLKEVVSAWFTDKITFKLAHQLRETTKTPIVFSPMPFPSEDMRQKPGGRRSVPPELFERILAAFEGTLRDHGFDVIPQPISTLAKFPSYTRREFSVGSVQLRDRSVKHPADDFLHMNPSYGVEVLKAIQAFVECNAIGAAA